MPKAYFTNTLASRFRLAIFILLSSLATLLVSTALHAEEKTAEAVLAAWKSNQAKLGAVKIEITDVLENHTVTETKTEVHKLPSGGSLTITQSPRSETSLDITIFLDQLIYANQAETRQQLFDGTKWQEHKPENNTLILRRIDQMPGMSPLDPREFFLPELRKPFLKLAKSATFTTTDDTSAQPYPVQMTFDNGFNRLIVFFDPNQALLPVESLHFHSDGSVLRHTMLEYERVESRDAFLISSAKSHFYAKGVATSENLESAPPEHSVSRTVSKVTLLPPPESGELGLEVPAGIRVIDLTQRN